MREADYFTSPLLFRDVAQELAVAGHEVGYELRLERKEAFADLIGVLAENRRNGCGQGRDADCDRIKIGGKKAGRDPDLGNDKGEFANRYSHQSSSQRLALWIIGYYQTGRYCDRTQD